MLQASVGNRVSLDPLSFCQDTGAAPEVDVGWGEIVDALVVTAVVVVVDEGGDLGFEVAGRKKFSNRMRFLRVWCQRSILPWANSCLAQTDPPAPRA